MGFLSGVITGVALAAGAAAWYMSRSGERFRDQYRVDRKLGELGDELEARTREIQASVNAQIAEMRAKADDAVHDRRRRDPRRRPGLRRRSRRRARGRRRGESRQGQEGRQGRRLRVVVRDGSIARTLRPARLRAAATLARMCDGSLGSTSTFTRPALQESQCENGKSRIPPAKTSNRPAPATGLPD